MPVTLEHEVTAAIFIFLFGYLFIAVLKFSGLTKPSASGSTITTSASVSSHEV